MNNPSYNIFLNSIGTVACVVLLSACATTVPASFNSGHESPLVNTNARPTSVLASAAVQRSSIQPQYNGIDDVGPDAANVQVNIANPNKRFVLRPLGTNISADSEEQNANVVGNDYIKIIGSYFPKVVYRKPQLNSKLLMRVAPGSTFPLEKLDDGWYQISTKQGPGYLRLQDGKPTGARG